MRISVQGENGHKRYGGLVKLNKQRGKATVSWDKTGEWEVIDEDRLLDFEGRKIDWIGLGFRKGPRAQKLGVQYEREKALREMEAEKEEAAYVANLTQQG